ncbi:hypothetical protein QOZ80_5BG0452600 [Eleusine coracana subsp. coracana]|nr:hypothetical protein QOZ80_5BG0452600 [Eleusine coracana subsp. coracana]
MAAILEALAPYVKKMITDMAEEEVQTLLGVHDEMEKLGRNFDYVKAFLADAERRRIKDKLVQEWVMMLKGVMYDATDVLEQSQIEAEEQRESMEKMPGCFQPFLSMYGTLEKKMPDCLQPFLLCLRNPIFAHNIGGKIRELNQRLENIQKDAAKFNFTANLQSYPEQSSEAEYSSQKMTSEFIPTAIVGEKIERDTKYLVKELVTDENQGMKVVSIVGADGMGKTTLAQKILKDTTIDEHFKTKIWLSITHKFSEVELLRTAIKHAGGQHGGEENNTLLTQTLINTLSASKFLLVLDDMWSVRAWESVLGVPVTNASDRQPGSRVLVTTTIENLAPQMHNSFYQYHVSPLFGDDAWCLLKNQLRLSPYQVAGVDLLKEVGMKIIKKCGVHIDADGSWCSLDELAPLSQLRYLTLYGLANVVANTSFAENADISNKENLTYFDLDCNSSRGRILSVDDEIVHQQEAVKTVFEKLCPPTCIETVRIMGYFGRRLPNWMMAPTSVAFKSLLYLVLKDLPCCTQLPDGLCQLPSLKHLEIVNATAVKSVGLEFQAAYPLACGARITARSAAFPNLTNLFLDGLCAWEDWKWEGQDEDVREHTMAMPTLKFVTIKNCKLRCLPPGLASSKRHALRELRLYGLTNLTYVKNFPSIVELDVFHCPELKRIGGSLARLHKIRIVRCPNLEVLEGVPTLDSLVLEDASMKTLPEYLQSVNPRHLKLNCGRLLYESLSLGGSEWDMISHIRTTAINCL